MEFGASIFFTDYSITPAELAVALEERGFDSVWAAEHSHIPVPRKTDGSNHLPPAASRTTRSPEAVTSEPVSEWGEFPASWENTGNFAPAGHPRRIIGPECSSD
jgi:alkanesulfonate monooxygenase SsuD/methylene tetrahydromethanopterin reductase-like flavin-dependent oxidoreductase (luciferase family)